MDTEGARPYPAPTPNPEAFVSVPPCLFCRIVAGEIPADVVLETDRILAFRDIAPKAPTHVLVIPKAHITSLAEAADDEVDLLGAILLAARHVAEREGVRDSGFRTVLNSGAHGGQEVMHLHAHVLGGRALAWPPG
jgi:histidine triad (HIT) family protein